MNLSINGGKEMLWDGCNANELLCNVHEFELDCKVYMERNKIWASNVFNEIGAESIRSEENNEFSCTDVMLLNLLNQWKTTNII